MNAWRWLTWTVGKWICGVDPGPLPSAVELINRRLARELSELSEQTERADFYAARVLQIQGDCKEWQRHVLKLRDECLDLKRSHKSLDEQNSRLLRKLERYQRRLTEWAPIIERLERQETEPLF